MPFMQQEQPARRIAFLLREAGKIDGEILPLHFFTRRQRLIVSEFFREMRNGYFEGGILEIAPGELGEVVHIVRQDPLQHDLYLIYAAHCHAQLF